MATQKFTKIYTGTLAQIKNVSPEAGALYIATDAKVGFKNGQQILGNFLTASSVNDANIQGVLYHIPASGENPAEFGYWNGTAFVDIVKGSDIVALEQRVSNLEALHAAGNHEGKSTVAEEVAAGINALDVTEFALTSVADGVVSIYGIKEGDGKIAKGENKIDLAKVASTGKAEDVAYGSSNVKAELDKIEGDATTDGSIAKQVADAKKAIEGTLAGDDAKTLEAINNELDALNGAIDALDYTDTKEAGKVVVKVSQENGKIAVEREAITVAKVAIPDSKNAAEYQIKVGDTAVETKIEIPFAESVLHNAVLSDMNATVDPATGAVTAGDSKGADALVMVFKKADGTFTGVKTDLSKILFEAEFKDGLAVAENGEVSVATAEDNYIGIDDNKKVGVKVVSLANASATKTGLADAKDVKDAIDGLDNEIKALDGSATIATLADGVVTIKAGVAQEDGLVKQGSGANITLAKIATTGAAADMSVAASAANNLDAGTAQDIFEKLSKAVKDIQVGSVTSFAGQTGAITVDTEGTAADAVKFTVGDDKKLTGSIHYGSFAKDTTEAVDGIAKVSDVAAEIAAAKAAIKGALTETDAQTLKALNDKIDAIDKTHVTVVKASTADELSVDASADAKTFTIGLTKATYTTTTGIQNDTISDTGLVDGKMLKDYVNDYAIYWVEL